MLLTLCFSSLLYSTRKWNRMLLEAISWTTLRSTTSFECFSEGCITRHSSRSKITQNPKPHKTTHQRKLKKSNENTVRFKLFKYLSSPLYFTKLPTLYKCELLGSECHKTLGILSEDY